MNYILDFHNIKCSFRQGVAIAQCGLLTSYGECHSVPRVYDNYVLTFVIKGEGTYVINDVVHSVKAGQGMLTTPNTLTYWTTPDENPWQYIFIVLNGIDCKNLLNEVGLGTKSKIFDFVFDDKVVDHLFSIYESSKSNETNEYDIIGYFYLIMGSVINNLHITKRNSEKKSVYLENAINYINNNYCYNITINDIAEHLNIERTYLYKIFSRELGISPIQFLNEYRLKKAVQMMEHDTFSAATIATSVGFYDFSHFSHAFQKKYGMSPGKYRKQLSELD